MTVLHSAAVSKLIRYEEELYGVSESLKILGKEILRIYKW